MLELTEPTNPKILECIHPKTKTADHFTGRLLKKNGGVFGGLLFESKCLFST